MTLLCAWCFKVKDGSQGGTGLWESRGHIALPSPARTGPFEARWAAAGPPGLGMDPAAAQQGTWWPLQGEEVTMTLLESEPRVREQQLEGLPMSSLGDLLSWLLGAFVPKELPSAHTHHEPSCSPRCTPLRHVQALLSTAPDGNPPCRRGAERGELSATCPGPTVGGERGSAPGGVTLGVCSVQTQNLLEGLVGKDQAEGPSWRPGPPCRVGSHGQGRPPGCPGLPAAHQPCKRAAQDPGFFWCSSLSPFPCFVFRL